MIVMFYKEKEGLKLNKTIKVNYQINKIKVKIN